MSKRIYEYKQEQAKLARSQAKDLRKMHEIASCGLNIKINYGTYYVPQHIAMRIADQFPIWAAEYDAVADQLEAEMESMFSVSEG